MQALCTLLSQCVIKQQACSQLHAIIIPACCCCRCFPKFPENFTSSVYSMMDTTSGVLQSATGTLKNAFSATGPQFSQHVADISKGVLIIVIGGLACGVLLSLVSVVAAALQRNHQGQGAGVAESGAQQAVGESRQLAAQHLQEARCMLFVPTAMSVSKPAEKHRVCCTVRAVLDAGPALLCRLHGVGHHSCGERWPGGLHPVCLQHSRHADTSWAVGRSHLSTVATDVRPNRCAAGWTA